MIGQSFLTRKFYQRKNKNKSQLLKFTKTIQNVNKCMKCSQNSFKKIRCDAAIATALLKGKIVSKVGTTIADDKETSATSVIRLPDVLLSRRVFRMTFYF